MSVRTRQRAERLAASLFVALVTTCLLAFVFAEAARGTAGLPAASVYAFAAGFGLEFVGVAWTGRRREDAPEELTES